MMSTLRIWLGTRRPLAWSILMLVSALAVPVASLLTGGYPYRLVLYEDMLCVTGISADNPVQEINSICPPGSVIRMGTISLPEMLSWLCFVGAAASLCPSMGGWERLHRRRIRTTATLAMAMTLIMPLLGTLVSALVWREGTSMEYGCMLANLMVDLGITLLAILCLGRLYGSLAAVGCLALCIATQPWHPSWRAYPWTTAGNLWSLMSIGALLCLVGICGWAYTCGYVRLDACER
ncbi:hypothetical protein [Bifidobacterium cuniculi]|uniref:Uncharacterized protein n=1 Tax=Bifidobacterium cuniculi TaxID=1688 RepID=A0A087AT43_9BIFI|nr:hypothetical protein [Bifidobacterium cuniculi]KFI61943.1 hypothetical protein BCUN_1848 [Bifidobacterium cuniculi]